MSLTTIGGEIQAQELNDNFSFIKELIDHLGVNVKDVGAKGDGLTDDTVSIQKAVNENSKVIFPSGTFMVDTISISSDVELILHEDTIIKQISGKITPLITISNISSFILMGGTFDGVGNSLASNGLIYINTVDDVIVKTKVLNSGRDGIKINNCGKGNLDLYISDAELSGLNLTDSSYFDINVDIDGTDDSGVLIVPVTKSITNVNIKGIIKNCARTSSIAIGVYFASGDIYIVENSTISVSVYDAGYVGIYPGGDNNTCVDCIVDGAGLVTAAAAHGIRVHDSAHISLINCKAINCARSGISINKAHDINIVGCHALNNQQHGFWFVYDTGITGRYTGNSTNKDVNLTGCFANNNGTSLANNYAGFYVDGYRNIMFISCQAHDYQTIQTQQRGIRANTNVKHLPKSRKKSTALLLLILRLQSTVQNQRKYIMGIKLMLKIIISTS